MKKRIASILSAVFLACLSVIPLFGENEPRRVEAGVIKTTGYEDDFNAETFNEHWTTFHGAQADASYTALHFAGAYKWEGGIVINRAFNELSSLTEKDTFELSLEIEENSYGGANWFGLGFGLETPTKTFFSADGALVTSVADTRLLVNSGGTIVDTGLTNAKSVGELISASLDKVLRFEYLFRKNSDGLFDVDLHIYRATEYDKTQKTGEFETQSSFLGTWENIEIANKYFVFNAMNLVADIFKVEVKKNGNTLFFDDFSNPSISYADEGVGDENWHICATYTKKQIYIAPIGKAKFTNGARLVYNERIGAEKDYVDKLYSLSGKITVEEGAEGTLFGVGLGLSDIDSAVEESNFIGIRKETETDTYSLICMQGNQISASTFSISLKSGETYSFEVNVYSDKRAELTVGAHAYTFALSKIEGYACITSIANDGSLTATFDDFTYLYYDTKLSGEKDAVIGFGGTKEKEGFSGVYEYYINERKWYLGTGVSLPAIYNKKALKDTLIFSNCTQYSSFGPKMKYDEYMLQFNVKLASEAKNDAMFGISFGRTSFASNIDLTTAVGFMCNGYEKIHKADEEKTMQTTLRGINVKNSHGDVYSYIRENGEPVNLWEKDEDGKYKTYNILFIVRNRSVEVYYKEKNQDISVLGILRAKYVDVNTYGYVAVFGANGVSFEISDFKLTNLSIA